MYSRPSEIVFDLIDADSKHKRMHVIENVMREDSDAAVIFIAGMRKALDHSLQYNVSEVPFAHYDPGTELGEDWYKVRSMLTTLSSYLGNRRNINHIITKTAVNVHNVDWNMFYGPILLKRPKFEIDYWTWNECARNVSNHLVIT